ncbi:MAG TPA: methyltransferase domain-containing protein, partial [Bacteroidia bacterium]
DKGKPAFSYKIYGNIANYFENETDLVDFFEFQKGQQVAEVGTGNGHNIAGFSLISDSISFYAQDIDIKALNEKSFAKALDKVKKYKSSNTCTFKLCIGTEKATNLPVASFDKIILSASFHEFTFIDEMLSDIYKKLKPGGKLYVVESKCLAKTHKNYTSEEVIGFAEKNRFKLAKKDGKDLNGSSGLYRLIFSKQ